jgi:hypothetical protein
LIDLDLPDWPLLIEERDNLLELAKAESTWRFGPLGDVLEQTDAKGNTQSFAQTVAGSSRRRTCCCAIKRRARCSVIFITTRKAASVLKSQATVL